MILKSVIRDLPTNSVEVTWVNASGLNVKCRSYAGVQVNEMVSDLGSDAATYASLIATVRAVIGPYVPPPFVPAVVTPFQAKAALYGAGLLPSIQAIMANPATPELTKLAWAETTEFTRDSPLLNSLAVTLGLSAAQVDALFLAASAIEA